MRILLSNDDGIDAPGIRVLAERLSRDHQVYVVAPDRERSATGHSLTLHKPLRVNPEQLSADVVEAWSTTGTPSDCVKLAVSELLPERPDVVISGINNGPNLGSEILYSGTVAAAMEAAFMGLRSIAVSLFWGEKRHFDVAAEIISRFLPVMEKAPLKERSLYNINVPNVPLAEIKGVRATEAGIRLYNDFFEKRIDPRGKVYYWLTGHAIDQNESEKSDVFAVLNNFVSITPVAFNMTDHQALEMISALSFLKESSISDEPGTKLSGNKSAGGASGARQGGLAG